MRRKVNNSETHEIKRYYKVPSEKVQEWSDTIENLTKQSDQFKAERDTLIDDLSWYKAKVSRLERELSAALDGELAKYDELQDYVLELQSDLKECQKENEKLNNITEEAMDIAESENYKAEKLERENGQLKKEEKVNRTKASLLTEIEILKEKNDRLRKVNSNGWKQKDKVINNLLYLYSTLTDHIRLKAENNPGVSRYIDLVNYIDRLERD